MTGESSNGEELLRRLNTAVPHPARVYDVWLGGKDNYPADRAAAAAGLEAFPSTIQSVRANRAFLARAVEYLAAGEGIRQFLDIGTGLPSANNTHEVAQATAEESRVVYVDNDPVVMLHGLHRGRPARPGSDPRGGEAHAGLHPAGRHHAHRDPAFHFRRRSSLRNC